MRGVRLALLASAIAFAGPAWATDIFGGGGGSSNLTGGTTPVAGGNCATVGNFLKVGSSNILDCAASSSTIAFPQAVTGGTSGGIPYLSNATTLSSSGVLAANALVVGGGAGVAPSTVTTNSTALTALASAPTGSGVFVLATSPTLVTPVLGAATATSLNKVAITAPATAATFAFAADAQTFTFAATGGTVLTSTGSLTSGNCLKSNASGQIIDSGGTCGGSASFPITGTGATVTTSTPLLDLSQTWNAGAVTFTAIKSNITNTASASGSLLLDLQVGGSSAFSVDRSSKITIAGNTGFISSAADGGNSISVFTQYGGTFLTFRGNGTGVTISGSQPIGWAPNSAPETTLSDLLISRVTTGVLKVASNGSGAGAIVTDPKTVANLPAAATVGGGGFAFVTDATSCTRGSAVTGGGSTKCPVYTDGSSWLAL